MIESQMREQQPSIGEVVFVLSAAEGAAVLAHEPKMTKMHASNQVFKALEPLPPPMASAVAPGSVARIGSNGCRSSSSSGSQYCPSKGASDAGPRVVTLRSKKILVRGHLEEHPGTKVAEGCAKGSFDANEPRFL